MKQFKGNDEVGYFSNEIFNFFLINFTYQGLFSDFTNNKYIHKGYYNNDEKYGHWLKCNYYTDEKNFYLYFL